MQIASATNWVKKFTSEGKLTFSMAVEKIFWFFFNFRNHDLLKIQMDVNQRQTA